MSFFYHFINFFRRWRVIKAAQTICEKHKVVLQNKLDHVDANVVLDIFQKRIYGYFFPFYKNCIIVDIGAHKGFFSIFANKYSGGESSIYAVEPEPGNYLELTNNLKKNDCHKVTCIQAAISGTTGKKELFISTPVNHSLIKSDVNHPYISQSKSIIIQSFSLPDFMAQQNISHIDFLKLDCEGCEYDIIFNNLDTVTDKVTTIAMEFHDISDANHNIHSLTHILLSHGFKIGRFDFQPTFHPLQMGVLIVTKEPQIS